MRQRCQLLPLWRSALQQQCYQPCRQSYRSERRLRRQPAWRQWMHRSGLLPLWRGAEPCSVLRVYLYWPCDFLSGLYALDDEGNAAAGNYGDLQSGGRNGGQRRAACDINDANTATDGDDNGE